MIYPALNKLQLNILKIKVYSKYEKTYIRLGPCEVSEEDGLENIQGPSFLLNVMNIFFHFIRSFLFCEYKPSLELDRFWVNRHHISMFLGVFI